ncbi:DCR2 (YLR361C) [Zygosaccharomyces parabailii]|nr:DCR2 (YLR361C) [Zygosaccharomyces parabailii]CDH17906.1 related to Phosphatase DCR2 [Zygosaccharomyces bailii ISA1307]SJM83659.1 related to Phosphatase DCR2 [Zygosaccharomyces bailii]
MPILSKRYLRYLPYILLFVFLEKSVIFGPWHQSSFPFKRKADHIRSHSSLRAWLRANNLEYVDEYDHVVVNVGRMQCFHLGDWWSHCAVKDELKPQNSAEVQRKIIRKDLLGAKTFGFSDYLFYDTLSIYSISQLEDNDQKEQVLLTAVSEQQSPDSQKVYNFYVNFVPLQVEYLTNGTPIISDFNVLFGDDCVDPRNNWELDKSWILYRGQFPSYLSIRRLSAKHIEDWHPRLTVREDGTYKIVQLADLHFSVGKGECRDEFPKHDFCEADPKTIKFVEEVLDLEEPDMVVFTGDQIMGDRAVQDSETALLKAVAPVIKRRIPWAMVWGNHDDEGSLSRWSLSKFASGLPYSLFTISPRDTKDNTFGVGNYYHQILDYEKKYPVLTFYFLDSHKYSTTGKIFPGYDWIKEAQWDYLEKIYDEELYHHIKEIPAYHLSMAFFHIPLPEYLNEASKRNPGESNPIIGNAKEGVTAPKYHSNGVDSLVHMNVQATSCGHDHCNDYCLLDDSSTSKLWLCYGGAVGEGGYGGYGGYERRIRMYQFQTKQGNIYTWKRLNGSPINYFDYQPLALGGVSSTG